MEEINLLDFWRILVRWKTSIVLIVFVASLCAIFISGVIPKTYRAEATLLPIGGQRAGNMAAAAASQAGLGGLLGGQAASQSAQMLAILQSRSLAERIIDKFHLMPVFFEKLWDEKKQQWNLDDPKKQPVMEDAVNELLARVSFNDDKKNQVIQISAVMKDPQLASDVVNGYINELIVAIRENAFTAAKRNRIFLEGQLERNKADLLESGKALAFFYSSNRISNVVPTVDIDVSTNEVGGGQVAVSPTGSPADLLQQQLDDTKAKVEKARIIKDVPQQTYLQYLNLQRQLLGQMNSLLAQQYEMAKIEETKDELSFQVIDWARAPHSKFKPKRAQIVISTFILSLFFAVFYALIREYLGRINEPTKADVRG